MSLIKVDVSGAESALRQAEISLQHLPLQLPLAVSRSLNRAVSAGRTGVTREVRKEYTIKAGAVRESMSISMSNRNNLEGTIISKGRPRSFSQYRLSPNRDTTGDKRKQPRVAVKKGGSLKPLGHFIYQGKVFARLGKSRLPVEHRVGPAVPSLLKNDNVKTAVQTAMSDTFAKRLDHEVNRILEGSKK